MKVCSKLVEVGTGPMKLHPIDELLGEAVEESSVEEGVLWVSVKGAAPALVILEEGPEERFVDTLRKLIPITGWRRGNTYAHLTSTLLSACLALPIAGKPLLDMPYRVYLLETHPVHNHRRTIAITIYSE